MIEGLAAYLTEFLKKARPIYSQTRSRNLYESSEKELKEVSY